MIADKNGSAGAGRSPADPNGVGLSEEWEVRSWCEKFGCSEVTLRKAVNDVGPHTADVQRRLRELGKAVFNNTGED